MEVGTQIEGDIAIISLSGQLDALTAPQVREAFREAGTGVYHAVVNLHDVTFIDSSGLASLISGLKIFRGEGREFRLAAVQPNVYQVFSLTMLDRAFRILPDVEAAVASVGAVSQ